MAEQILGIDVGKHQLPVALLRPERKPKLKAIANSADGHQALLSWLKQRGCKCIHACFESTSTYGEAIAAIVYQAGHQVSVVNPARIKGFAQGELSRTKSDKADAALIARFCAAMHPKFMAALARGGQATSVLGAAVGCAQGYLPTRVEPLGNSDGSSDNVSGKTLGLLESGHQANRAVDQRPH